MSEVEIFQVKGQHQKGRGAAGKGKTGGPPLYIGLAGALLKFRTVYSILFLS